MAVSSEGRMVLYMQEIKREHKHLMRKSEELTLSLSKIDTLYQAMQEQELKMKEMDEKLMALVEDDGDMMESLRQMKSDSHVQLEKVGTELQSLARKVARLDARASEHSMRFDNNLPLLRDIQKRLGQLENMADHSAKSKGKATKQSENQNVDHLVEQIVSMRASIQEQENNLKNFRGELDQVKHKARQAVRRMSEMTTQAEEQTVDDLVPLKTAPNRPIKKSRVVNSARSQKRQTIVPARTKRIVPTQAEVQESDGNMSSPPAVQGRVTRSMAAHSAKSQIQRQSMFSPRPPRATRMSIHSQAAPGPAPQPPHLLEPVAKGLSMSQGSREVKKGAPKRAGQATEDHLTSRPAPQRAQDEPPEQSKARKKRRPDTQPDVAQSKKDNAAPPRQSQEVRPMLQMNQSYPHLQPAQKLTSSDLMNEIGFKHDTKQRLEPALTTRKQDTEQQSRPAESSAQHKSDPSKVPGQTRIPRARFGLTRTGWKVIG